MDFYAALPRKEVQVANRLKMAMIQSILTLHAQGWTERRIARELQVNRETVSRYVRVAATESPGDKPKPANAPISGPGSAEILKPAIAPILG
jgi:transposase